MLPSLGRVVGRQLRTTASRCLTTASCSYNAPVRVTKCCVANARSRFVMPQRSLTTSWRWSNNGKEKGGEKTSNEEPDLDSEEARRERGNRAAKNMLRSGIFVLAISAAGVVYWIVVKGAPQYDDNGVPIRDEFSHMFAPWQYIRRAWANFEMFEAWITEPSREKLLPDPLPAGYHQPEYTLVIELDGVLVHPEWTYGTGWRWKKRQAIEHFLRNVGYPYYEVVIYTHEVGYTAHPIVEQLDKEQRIMYRLYRDTTKFVSGTHKKDLGRLNRDLKKVICIDCDPRAVSDYPRNLLLVPRWTGDDEDTSLVDLAELLKVILATKPDDVRPVLEYYAQFDNPAKHFREASAELMKHQNETTPSQEKRSLAGQFSGKMFGNRRHSFL